MATPAVPTPASMTAVSTRAGARRHPLRAHLPAYLMCAPTVTLFLVFMVFPIGFVLYSSFLDWDGIGSIRAAEWTGFENYRRLATDETWWRAVRNTLVYAGLKLVV